MLSLLELYRVVIKESEIVDNADEICKDRYVKWIEGEFSEGISNTEISKVHNKALEHSIK